MEFKIKEESPLCQMTLSQFRKKYGNIIICAIERQGQLTIPDGDFTLQAFDKIFYDGNRVEIVNFHNSIRPQVVKSLLLIGAGKISYYLLNILENSNGRST